MKNLEVFVNMKLFHFICFTTFFVMLKFGPVISHTQGLKDFLSVLVGDYKLENDSSLDYSYVEEKYMYMNLSGLGLGNTTMIKQSKDKDNGYISKEAIQVISSGNRYILRSWLINVNQDNKQWTHVTKEDITLYPECDVNLTLVGRGRYSGTTVNCIRPDDSGQPPSVLNVTLNCTHYVIGGNEGYASFRKLYSYSLPEQLAVSPSTCPDLTPIDPIY